MANITRLLLDAGDYQTADFINYLYKVPNYNLLAAQSALFDKNVPVADKYLASISAGAQYDELIAFKGWVSSLEPNYTLLTTETDAGKFMYMINERDLTLFTIDGDLGREISENNAEYPERLQNIFHNAKLLANYGFYAQAITLLSSEHLKCNTEYHIFRASLYEEMGNPRESYNQVEEGLVCDPTNSALLKEAVRYSRLLTRDAEADNYQARLKQLENLQK
jgi:hypothetical protein